MQARRRLMSELRRRRLVGRDRELAALHDTLVGSRPILTITGRGGIGKTHLVAVAADAAEATHRVIRVEVASDVDDLAMLDAVCSAAACPTSTVDDLAGWIGTTPTLLVLDGFELGVAAAALLVDLVDKTEFLTAWAVSRVSVPIPGARRMRIDPLTESAAIEVFVEAASAADAMFTADGPAADDVAAVCRASGGLPLALQLLAARCPALPVDAMRVELDRGALLALAASGDVDVRATVAWSIGSLGVVDRRALQRLSVFRGAFDLVAATQIAAFGVVRRADVFDVLAKLVDVHLLEPRHEPGHARYVLAADVRAVAAELLATSEDAPITAQRHAEYLRVLVAALGRLDTPEFDLGVARLSTHEDDLLDAVRGAVADGTVDLALELLDALVALWVDRGPSVARLRRLEELRRAALDAGQPADPVRLVRSNLWASAACAQATTEGPHVARMLDEASAIASRIDDVRLQLDVLACEVDAFPALGDVPRARHALGTALAMAHELGDEWSMARFEVWAAMAAQLAGDYDTAESLASSGLSRAGRTGDHRTRARAVLVLRSLPQEVRLGVPTIDELIVIARRTSDRRALLWLFVFGGSTPTVDPGLACSWLAEGLDLLGSADDRPLFAVYVNALFSLLAGIGEEVAAAPLLAVLAPWGPTLERLLIPTELKKHFTRVAAVRLRLGPRRFAELLDQGARLDAYELAMSQATSTAQRLMGRPTVEREALTNRERQVLGLIAEGTSNKEIATRLGIRSKTVMHHTVAIYRKLGVRGRGEAAALVRRAGVAG